MIYRRKSRHCQVYQILGGHLGALGLILGLCLPCASLVTGWGQSGVCYAQHTQFQCVGQYTYAYALALCAYVHTKVLCANTPNMNLEAQWAWLNTWIVDTTPVLSYGVGSKFWFMSTTSMCNSLTCMWLLPYMYVYVYGYVSTISALIFFQVKVLSIRVPSRWTVSWCREWLGAKP